ncbi:hypothetical protein ACB092_04G026700 [Castanea dentata]
MKSVSTEPSLQKSLLPCSDEVGLSNFHKCVMKSILYTSSATATFLMILPQVKVDGGLVPVFFRDRPRYYHMFVVSTVFAVMGAYGALVIQYKHKPRVEIFCRTYAMASMLSALAIVLYAAALWFIAPSPPLL